MERRRTPSLWATTSKATPSHFPRSISIRSSSTSGSSEKAAAVSYARVNGEETTASYRRPSTRRAKAATCRRPASLSPALPRPCQAAAALASDSAWRTRTISGTGGRTRGWLTIRHSGSYGRSCPTRIPPMGGDVAGALHHRLGRRLVHELGAVLGAPRDPPIQVGVEASSAEVRVGLVHDVANEGLPEEVADGGGDRRRLRGELLVCDGEEPLWHLPDEALGGVALTPIDLAELVDGQLRPTGVRVDGCPPQVRRVRVDRVAVDEQKPRRREGIEQPIGPFDVGGCLLEQSPAPAHGGGMAHERLEDGTRPRWSLTILGNTDTTSGLPHLFTEGGVSSFVAEEEQPQSPRAGRPPPGRRVEGVERSRVRQGELYGALH